MTATKGADSDSFFAWRDKELKSITSDDISAAGQRLRPPLEGEEVIGSLEGDSLRVWALVEKIGADLEQGAALHNKKHELKNDLSEDECRRYAWQVPLTMLRRKMLESIFWHDVRSQVGLHGSLDSIGLREGMRLVKFPAEQGAAHTHLVIHV
jgi:hypothetical protein